MYIKVMKICYFQYNLTDSWYLMVTIYYYYYLKFFILIIIQKAIGDILIGTYFID